jgi:lipoate-protein ligase A
MGSTLAQTYQILSDCLIRGLGKLGIRCEAHDSLIDPRQVRSNVKLPCFLAPNRDELMVGGKKLIGSAQKRTAEAVLQHGSIPLTGAFRQLPMLQRGTESERKALNRLLRSKCTSIREAAPQVTEANLVAALKEGFAEGLGVDVREQPWTDEEFGAIDTLSRSSGFLEKWQTAGAGRE